MSEQMEDVRGQLDNTVVAYVKSRRLRLVTRHRLFVLAVEREFVVKLRKRGPRNKYYTEEVEVYDIQQRPYGYEITTLAGLLHRVVRICNDLKVLLRVVDVERECQVANIMRLPELEYSDIEHYWPQLRDWQQEMLRLMMYWRCGRVKVSTGGGKSEFIKVFCSVARKIRICVTTEAAADANNLYVKLQSAGLDVGMIGGGRKDDDTHRILVVTTKSLQRVSHIRFDVVIGDEIHTMAAATLRTRLWQIESLRIFGFSANQDDRADNGDLWIEGLFGPVILTRTYQENQQAGDVCPIRYRFIQTGCSKQVNSTMAHIRQRYYVIRNHERNEQFARVARFYLEQGRQVLVLVRTTEHVLRMKQLLPDALCVFRTMSDEQKQKFQKLKIWQPGDYSGSNTKEMHVLQEAFASRKHMLAIANSVWHKGKDFRPLDTVLRLDGMSSSVQNTQLSGRLSRISEGKQYGLLVDGLDEFDPSMQRAARKRRQFYRSQGWEEYSTNVPD